MSALTNWIALYRRERAFCISRIAAELMVQIHLNTIFDLEYGTIITFAKEVTINIS